MPLTHASLPQNDGPLGRAERKVQLAAARLLYDYEYGADDLLMPLARAAGPLSEALTSPRWDAMQVKNNLSINRELERFDKNFDDDAGFAGPADYARLFTSYPVPDIASTWASDRSFADQRVAGLNPMRIALVAADAAQSGSLQPVWEHLSARLNPQILDDATLHTALGPTATWASAVSEKRVFVADYKILETLVADPNAPGEDKGKRVLAPIALFVRKEGDDGLTPVAIQLGQSNTSSPVHFPNPSPAWLMAKTFVQTADVNHNQLINHLGLVHLIQDAFAVAMHRQLDDRHPLRRLLAPHFEAMLVINFGGEKVLVGSKGIVAKILEAGANGSTQLINEAYSAWSVGDLDFVENIRSRGLLDADALPYFPYRDDGMKIWNVLGAYVQEYLEHYYGRVGSAAATANVTEDTELQAWLNELSAEGTGDGGGMGKVKGLPPAMTDLSDLITLVHRLIWTASAQHAAVNFPQVVYTAFVPNQPTANYLAPIAGPVSMGDITQLLPPKDAAKTQFQTSFQLAGFHYDQLLDYAKDMDDDAAQIVAKYHEQLVTTVTAEMNQANALREQRGHLTYPWLLPANIPNSTSV